jgi:outer membrane receptor protein involved in Fe transport
LITQNNGNATSSRAAQPFYGNSRYDGQQDINASMVWVKCYPRTLEAHRGVRYETTFLEVNSTAYQSADVFTGTIEQGDLLPAVSLQWSPRKDMTVRAGYSETVARPTSREFARYRSFDPAGDQIIEGNPYLRMTQIQNLDLRWEWFTPRRGLLSVGRFYKLLIDPIEKFNAGLQEDGTPTWTSLRFRHLSEFDEATVWGVEFEGRQNPPSSLCRSSSSARGSTLPDQPEVALQPEIQQLKYVTTGEWVETRPLYDQSPYILNADLTYDNKRSGTTVSLVFYYAAERLALIVNNGWDVYEQGTPQHDLVISQRLGKGFKLKFSAKNLLNPEIIRSYGVGGPTDTTYRYSSYTKGITFGLSASYEF